MKAHFPLKSQEKYTCQTEMLLGKKKKSAGSKRKKRQASVKADAFGHAVTEAERLPPGGLV